MSFRVFVRNWWRPAEPGEAGWPDGRVPYPGAPKRVIRKRVETEEEARAICQEYNRTHAPGKWSRKAEYEEL